MKIITELDDIETLPNPVLTIGNFDGVHLGHQAILKKVKERARAIQGTSVVFTFEPHPLKVLIPERAPKLLDTCAGRLRLFEAAGVEVVICAKFTRNFADQDPERFARDILVKKIGAREVYVGYDYAFGKGRKGNIEFLKEMGAKYGFAVGVVDAVTVDGVVVSSSLIRDLITAGRVADAAKFLGRNYTIEGTVVHGSHRGHDLGFPTANVKTESEVIPGYGVYAVRTSINGRPYEGVASIGIRPTFGGGPVSIEIYIFEFDRDIYDKHVEVFFIERLRDEEKFPDADALVRQMREDTKKAKQILERVPG